MAGKIFVEYEVSKEDSEKVLDALEAVKESGNIRKGVNETTKAIERGIAKLVVVAMDVQPEEIVMHIPALCKEKKAPYIFVESKEELGKAVGLEVSTASVAVVEEGRGKKNVDEVIERIKELQRK
ncbi:MAG: 50S ribosomal protein L7Ae [Nanoarchaeota archaeon]|nr:50S ribosomal protein L7Ae [Nanoarchaeota archaeon]MBU4452051.1 50S ribosomal protein L7Ae [Nanoarchaeota archaeon]MCG2723190.1 50S ribosomal protein L7Ae [archaeon]